MQSIANIPCEIVEVYSFKCDFKKAFALLCWYLFGTLLPIDHILRQATAVSTKKLFWGSCVTVSVKANQAKTDRQPSGDFGQSTQKESIDHEKASSFCPMLSVFESFKKILGHFIRVSKVGNICFLSPLVPSKQEDLALLSFYTFWGKCGCFSIFEWWNSQSC